MNRLRSLPIPHLRRQWIAATASLCLLMACIVLGRWVTSGDETPAPPSATAPPRGTAAEIAPPAVRTVLTGNLTAVERQAVTLRMEATSYQQLNPAAPGTGERASALAAISRTLSAIQSHYWTVAPLVLAMPRLRGLDLGVQTASVNLRPDAGTPLARLATLLATEPDAAPVHAGPDPALLVADAQLLLDRAGRLAVSARASDPTVGELAGALRTATGVVAADARRWAQTPTASLNAARDAAMLSGTAQMLDRLPAVLAPTALIPELVGVRRLASLSVGAPRDRVLAAEVAWQSTDLATRAARGDDYLGPRATAALEAESALFGAWRRLIAGDRAGAAAGVSRAARVIDTQLSPLLTAQTQQALAIAAGAVRTGAVTALARARGQIVAEIVSGAYGLTVAAISRGDAAAARTWAAVRDFGPGAAGSNGADSMTAVDELAAGQLSRARAVLQVRRDELAAIQGRDVALVGATMLARTFHQPALAAQDAALVAGYWSVLAPVFSSHVGASPARATGTALAALQAGGTAATAAAGLTLAAELGEFTAAPATAAEREQSIRELVRAARFTLTRTCSTTPAATPAAQLPGSVSGAPLVRRLINDLRPGLDRAQIARLGTAERALLALPGSKGASGEELAPFSRLTPAVIANCHRVIAGVQSVFGGAWQASNDDSDFNRIGAALAAAQADAAAHNWGAAADAARAAYGIFDVSAELSLRAVDPGLATSIEGLFWNGSRAVLTGLDRRSPLGTTIALDRLHSALLQARVALDSSHSTAAVEFNSAVVVIREGVEAALVILALGMGFVASDRRWRRPVLAGALAAAPATAITWLAASQAVGALASYGQRLQAALDLIALGVLAVMLAWFFRKYCWTRFVAGEQARYRRLLGSGRRPAGVRAVAGLSLLGFMVVYREGFETVLFLQAARAQAGDGTVVAGALMGGVATTVLAAVMIVLRRRLPYRRLITVVALVLAAVAVALTGQTLRSLQAVGWLSITPVPLALPGWAGLWLGLYPSVQTLAGQILAVIAILAGRWGAERLRARRLARRMRASQANRAPRQRTTAPAPVTTDAASQADRLTAGPRAS